MLDLIYQTSPRVTFATNTFINVPVILQFDDTPLISLVREQNLGITTEIPIYHSDGTYLAKVRGTRIYPTEGGKTSGLEIRKLANMTVCTLDKRTVFEIKHEAGDAFKTTAELYTPNGYFLKCDDTPKPGLFTATGEALRVGGITMSRSTFQNLRIGVWLRSDGSCSIGVS
jgi:hypothetical protein